jgi:hypothetical protein
MALYAHPWRKSMGLTRGVNLPVSRQARGTQPAAGRPLGSSADVHAPVTLTLQWAKGGGEPWVRVSTYDGVTRTIPGTKALWEVVLIVKGWDRGS